MFEIEAAYFLERAAHQMVAVAAAAQGQGRLGVIDGHDIAREAVVGDRKASRRIHLEPVQLRVVADRVGFHRCPLTAALATCPPPAPSGRECWVIVVRLVHPRGDRPHHHQLGRERHQQIAGVGLDVCQPAFIGLRRQDDRHAVMDVGDKLVGRSGDDAERADDLAGLRMLPSLPDTGNAERLAGFHGDGIGLLALAPLTAFHSKKLSTGTMQRRLA